MSGPSRKRGWLWATALSAGFAMASSEAIQDYINNRADAAYSAQFEKNNRVFDDAQRILIREIYATMTHARQHSPDVKEARGLLAGSGTFSGIDPSELPRLRAWKSNDAEFYRLTSKTGGQAVLAFFGGEWGAVWSAPEVLPQGIYGVTDALGIIRPCVLAAWCGALCMVLFGGHRRRDAAEVLLAFSLACVLSYAGRIPQWRWHGLVPQAGPTFRVLLVPLSAVLLGIFWWRERRPNLRICQTCGYDLFANTSGVCPECGATIPTKQAEHLDRLWQE